MTQDIVARFRTVTPNGSQTRSKAPGNVGPMEQFPLYAVTAHGPSLVAVDSAGESRSYFDCAGSNAAVPLGYGHPDVMGSVLAALMHGNMTSLPTGWELKTSQRFLDVCAPWADQVRWVKSGTEAMMAAVRIARAVTGRDTIVVMESSYHGWSDLNDARHVGQTNGVPAAVKSLTRVVPYHQPDPSSWVTADVAAVLVEPHRWMRTDVAWLRAVRDACDAVGAIFIMDEMVYGMRWRRGGATEYYGVEPHLAAFGKGIGNGFPVACVCGPRTVMDAAATKYISGTYFGDSTGLSAVHAVLSLDDFTPLLWEIGEAMFAVFVAAASPVATLEYFPVHWRLKFGRPEDVTLLPIVQQKAAARGILLHQHANNVNVAAPVDSWVQVARALGECVLAAAAGRS